MIQILGLRSFVKDGEKITYDAFHDKLWRAPSIAHLFANIDEYLAKIPQGEQWNLFYTVANCKEGKREFMKQEVLAIDVDGINPERFDETANICLAALGVKRDETALVSSGNGLHLLIGLQKPISRREFFKEYKPQFKALATRIEQALTNAGLPGKADTTVFEPRRILRLPKTVNRKPNKPEKLCQLIQPTIIPVDFDLEKVSGLPRVALKEQVPENYLKRFSTVDADAVTNGCDFLKWAAANPNQVSEPQWYAALSIVGRFAEGKKAAHEISKGHKAYSPAETDAKLEQALEASGPRTCESIGNIWHGCAGCPNFRQVRSPIMLRGADHIATEGTGFHIITWKANGDMGKLIPCYDDLRRFFERLHPYVCLGDSRIVMAWTGTHYEPMGAATIEQFAQEHFDPTASSGMVREFRELVSRTNIKPLEWFNDTTAGLANFRNGVLDIRTGKMMPHDPDRGFRHCLDFDYDPTALCPVYDAMMARISQGNKDMERVLDEFAWYCLEGSSYYIHKALMAVGDGANGKSTWIKALRMVAGPNNHSSMTISDLEQSEYNRQLIDGKLFNVSEETKVKALADASMFKRLVGGGVIQVRKIYKDAYEIENRAKLIITCNQLPQSSDPTLGFHRRFVIVPFNATFDSSRADFDPLIDEKLQKELSGIYNRFFARAGDLRARKSFSACASIVEASAAYVLDTDNVKRWLQENIAYDDNGGMETKFILISDLYTSYRIEMESGGERAVSMQAFAKRLPALIRDYAERFSIRKVDKKTVRGLRGIDFFEGAGLSVTLPADARAGAVRAPADDARAEGRGASGVPLGLEIPH